MSYCSYKSMSSMASINECLLWLGYYERMSSMVTINV